MWAVVRGVAVVLGVATVRRGLQDLSLFPTTTDLSVIREMKEVLPAPVTPMSAMTKSPGLLRSVPVRKLEAKGLT